MGHPLGLLCATGALVACAAPAARPADGAAAAAPEAYIDERMIDRSVDPCVDFYQYACGGWLATARIPDGRTRISTFQSLIDDNRAVLRAIVAEAQKATDRTSPTARLVGDYAAACLAAEAGDPGAEAALAAELAQIAAVRDGRTLAAAVARSQLLGGGIRCWWSGVGTLFSLSTDYDLHDGGLVVAQLDQGGLRLPDRSFYLDADVAAETLRARYRDHVLRMLALTGSDPAAARAGADAVLRIETALARASVSEEARRDPGNVDHRMTRAQVRALMPHFDWDAYFAALGVPGLDAINVMVPDYYRALDQLLAATPAAELESYLRWHLLDELGAALPPALAAEHRAFQAALTGAAGRPPRADECLDATDADLGWAMGALFVERRFPPAAQRGADAVVDAILRAFDDDLDHAPWLDAATRAAAKAKLRAVGRNVGVPAHLRSYAALGGAVDRTSFLHNHIVLAAFDAAYWLHRAGTRPPRDEWLMRPQEFDAYYDIARNEMVFPAAILQPPFFYARGGAISNLGNIGWVMGHELSHGFDSEGRKFDASGGLHAWWSPEAESEFRARAECVARQYDAYEVSPGRHVDGRRTLTENIADVGAAKLAYEAYRGARRGLPRAPVQAGLDEEQQFFVSRAQTNCELATDEAVRNQVKSDVHPPWRFRMNGPFADLPAFAAAFHCPAGTPMAPRDRCGVW